MTDGLNNELPIGVFDSGVGGLTVLKALRQTLPHEHLIYLGDTARVPYGTKSPVSITRYAIQAAEHLRRRGIKLLVIACNTATAVALDELQKQLAPLPVVGVIEPGAIAAVALRTAGSHLVLATEATVRLGAYSRAINALDTAASVAEQPCELMVSLAEEGWLDDPIADAIVRRYLEPWLPETRGPDARSIILGCTHFPLLRASIRRVIGADAVIIDSASTTARAVAKILDERGLRRIGEGSARLQLLATDGPGRFARVGGLFLEEAVSADDIELVDI